MNQQLRVAMVHSFYRSENPSGENLTVLRQRDLLAESGVEVELFSVNTDELSTKKNYQSRTAVNFALGKGNDLTSEIAKFNPSIVHVHNLFPNISETAISRLRVPYVVTIHNYRYLCANGSFFRDSNPCFECLKVRSIPGMIHSCYRDSRVATLPLAIRNFRPVTNRPLFKKASRIIFPSEYARSVFARGAELANSTVIHQPGPENKAPKFVLSNPQAEKWLFIGRLTVDKGLIVLMESWPVGRKLVIVGNGPVENEMRNIVSQRGLDIIFLGSVPHDQALDQLAQATGLVFTSSWPEVAPLVYAEALSQGKPVVSLGENTVSHWVQEHGTGYVVSSPDPASWNECLDRIGDNYEHLSSNCRKVFAREFSKERWISRIVEFYSKFSKVSGT